MKRLSLFLGLLLFFPALPEDSTQTIYARNRFTAPITQLVMHGEQDDYVGAGLDYAYTAANGSFGAQTFDGTSDGLADFVRITFLGNNNDFWTLDFGSDRLNSNLTPAFYNKAQRASFASDGHPGLDVSGNTRGCSKVTGKFIVLEANFDNSVTPPNVISFAAQFEQHCEGNRPALLGTIYYNYTPTVTVSVNPSSVSGGQTVLGAVTLIHSAPGGAVVGLASSNDALASVPSIVVVPPGQTSANFEVTTHAIKARPDVQIVATYAGVSNTANLTVRSPLDSLTQLWLHRDAGPFGSDFNLLFNELDGKFNPVMALSEGDVPDYSFIYFSNASHFWILQFSTKQLGIPLRPGFYPDAERAAFVSPGHPGLDVGGDGAGCNTVTGEFTILDAVFDDTISPPLIVSFAAHFTQFCEGFPPPLTGAVYFNYSPSYGQSPSRQ